MKFVALIPARGGSERIPDKNCRDLCGKPLIAWTIEAALASKEQMDVIVSTDSLEIGLAASAAGAEVPWLRPRELATSTASSLDVCIHAIDWYERERGQIDALILLQPTSPLRLPSTIDQGIAMFRTNAEESVVSFSKADSHPAWCYKIQSGCVMPYVTNEMSVDRSQDLPSAYVINGAVYIASPKFLRKNKTFLTEKTKPLIMTDNEESIDIDTEWDWVLAELLMERRRLKNSLDY